jgi:hypothetical protein
MNGWNEHELGAGYINEYGQMLPPRITRGCDTKTSTRTNHPAGEQSR